MTNNNNSLNRDFKILTKLTSKQKNEMINNNHEIVEKLKQKKQLINECVKKYNIIQNANVQ